MQHFGIIGKPLGHSKSKVYFDALFIKEHVEADFNIYELERIEDVVPLLDSLDGMNVTSPYKEAIIPYLDSIDPAAEQIGAVNVVHNKRGYNTDYIGVMETLRPFVESQTLPDPPSKGGSIHQKPNVVRALVLGTGGAAKAVRYALEQLGVQVTTVSRTPGKGDLTYADLTREVVQAHYIIANCTPLGMKPHENEMPEVNWITEHHLLFDCIYNPPQTKFLKEGEKHGAITLNGLGMFLGQAEAAWKIFRS